MPAVLNPMVSILMPVYNAEKYLQQAIEGVLSQTYRDFELIIINDGSTDHSEAIIHSFNDDRIVYRSKKNEGLAKTYNLGISMARGKYIRRHDADDISEPDMLALQMDFLEKHPDIQFVSTQCAFMTARGKIAQHCRHPKQKLFNHQPYVIVTPEHFNPYTPIEHGTVLGPTHIFREFGGYRPFFPISEDHDMWLRIIEKYRFAILNRCLYYHRMNEGSITKAYTPRLKFYRDLAMTFAMDRNRTGSDALMRGEKIPEPEPELPDPAAGEKAENGKLFRADLLNYTFKIMWDAKDWPEIFRIFRYAIRDGWRLKRTWKSILFTLLGPRMAQWGANIKSIFR